MSRDTTDIPDNEKPPEPTQPNPEVVGYRKPPSKTRFKPGQSGNKNGRPKGSKNLSTEIENALNERVSITQKGKNRKVPMKKVIAKQLVSKAAKGEDKSIGTILNYERQREATAGAGMAAPTEISDTRDKTVMTDILRRIREAHVLAEPIDDINAAEVAAPGDTDVQANPEASHD